MIPNFFTNKKKEKIKYSQRFRVLKKHLQKQWV